MEFCISPVIKGNEAATVTASEKLLNITAQYAVRTMALEIFIDLFVNLKSFMVCFWMLGDNKQHCTVFPTGRGCKGGDASTHK